MRALHVLPLFLAVLTTGCLTSEPDASTPSGGGSSGGKGDDATESCGSDRLIEAARHWAVVAGPDELRDDYWTEGSVESIEDLDGDSQTDLLIYPGHSFAGANIATIVAFSGGPAYDIFGCHVRFAGFFAGVSVAATDDGVRTHGARDIKEVNVSACEAQTLRWKFDGTIYNPSDDVTTMRVCE